MKLDISDVHPAETKKASVAEDFAKLETELKDYAIQHEVFVTEVELTYHLISPYTLEKKKKIEIKILFIVSCMGRG